MELLTLIRRISYRYAYLLIIAAWVYTISFLFQYYWSFTSSPSQVRNAVEKSIHQRQTDFDDLLRQPHRIAALVNETANEQQLKELTEKDYFIFLARSTAEGQKMTCWNTQVIAPSSAHWLLKDGVRFQQLINGYYVLIKKTVSLADKQQVIAIALIPVKWKYFVTTDYLGNGFAYHPALEKYFDISNRLNTPHVVRAASGEPLFSVEQKLAMPGQTGMITIVLRMVAMLLLLLFVHRLTTEVNRLNGFYPSLALLAATLIFLRLLSYVIPFPFNFRQFELFDPAVYGANFIHRSLGDLLLNALLVLWMLLFFRAYQPRQLRPLFSLAESLKAAVCAVALVLLSFFTGTVVRSLVADSQISFNVTQFFSLNFFSLIGFIVLGLLVVNYYLLVTLIYPVYARLCNNEWGRQLLYLAITGLVYITLTFSVGFSIFKLSVLGWLLITVWLLRADDRWKALLPAGGRMLLWLIYFSIALTVLLKYENSVKERNDRMRMAEKLGMQNDPSAENLLSIALTSFRGDFLRQEFSRFTTSGSAQVLRDSLLNENFSGYLNKFDTRIYVFSEKEEGLFNPDSTAFNTLNTIYNLQSRNTTVKDWRYYEESFDKFYYIARRVITDTGFAPLKGYVFVVSKPRLYAEGKFLPELFSRSLYVLPESNSAYAYAVYQRGELLAHFNDYPFPVHLTAADKPLPGFTEGTMGGFSSLWYNAGNDRVVLIINKQSGIIDAITLFAYLFCVFLLMLAAYRLVQLFIRNGLRTDRWKQRMQFSFRTEVHSVIIIISITSFLVIGGSTIIFFINRHNRTNKERLSRTIQIMRTEVEEVLQQHAVFDDVVRVYDEVASEPLQTSISRIAEIHGVDINLYDPEGNLRISSQPYYYNKGLLSRKLDPMAYHQLSRLHLVQTIATEKVGSRRYMSIYVPVRDTEGKTYAYVNIPYFTSETELKQEISNFLVTLINLNAFIFVIAGMLAFIITSRITGSFTLISDKMKEIQLGKPNEAIVWKRNDEIGALVAEYNKMVQQLEASAAKLAKSEREGAWREMARQVAHEIKNPLTPMKLSIQYLQKALDANAPSAKDIAENVSKTLVEQIDYLSTIASEFSNFANIGNPRMEKADLVQSIQSVVDLFVMEARGEIRYEHPSAPVSLMADKTHLNRLFTNLLRNALDAIPADRMPQVTLKLTVNEGNALIAITDNGTGIKPELRDRIFYPNFTTKTSGTGLGLAMCKGIVEQMKGDIWFQTETDKGTTFFVQVPVSVS